MMTNHLRRALSSLVLGVFLLPQALQAAELTNTVRIKAEPTTQSDTTATTFMSRGDFLRSSMNVLKFQLMHDTKKKPFPRIPASLLPYVQTADALGALKVFGRQLNAARPITRSEAIQVLVGLDAPGDAAKDPLPPFADVRPGTPEAAALAIALEREWIVPDTRSVFGAKRKLTLAEAQKILSQVLISEGRATDGGGQVIVVPLIRANPQQITKNLPKEDIARSVWNLLNNGFLYKDRLNEEKSGSASIEGMVNQLKDPYTVYLPPVRSQSYQQQLSGDITGIGASVEKVGEFLVVIAPLPGSPAEKAGVKARDIILSVDGVDLKPLDLDAAVDKVRGPKGSVAKLHILRDGSDIHISVTRDSIKSLEIQTSWNGEIAVLRLLQFGVPTERGVRQAFTDIALKNPKGIILDLRNNPGGLVDAAATTMSNFLPKGSTYVQTISQGATTNEPTREEPTVPATVPMVVLVNKGSASAAEIVAAALQDTKRATVVGEQTYGKGVFQQIFTFSDGSSLKMTSGRWDSPLGRSIEGKGVTPDVVVVNSDSGRDEQMIRALDILR